MVAENKNKMKDLSRVLAALDLSTMDEALLDYLAYLAPLIGMRKVYFLHVMPDFSLPANLDLAFHKRFAPEYPVDEKARDTLAQVVQSAFNGLPGLEMSVEVVEGKPYDKVLHWTQTKSVGLLAVGRKAVSEGSGITPRRVAARANCDILFVPPQPQMPIKRIVVPIDFSSHSAEALRTAMALRRKLAKAEVRCVYVVDLPPSDYYLRPMDTAGFRQILLESAQTAYANFLRDNNIATDELAPPTFLPNDQGSIVRHLDDFAKQQHADLVVMGAQGHSAFEKFFYGSVTEKFVEKCKDKPVLVVR
jgi:nucleotide-binding universal stress UspA family protein